MTILSFQERYINRIIWFLTSFTQHAVFEIHPSYCIIVFFLLLLSNLFHWVTGPQSAYLYTHWRTLSCFSLGQLWIELLQTFMYRFFYGHKFFIYLGRIFGREMAESYGNRMSNFLRYLQSICQSGCMILHSSQQYIWESVAPSPHQQVVLLVFLF